MPYAGGEHIYGSGSAWHYLRIMPEHIAWVVLILAGIALVVSVPTMISGDKKAKWLWFFVIIPAMLFIGFHSYMWYIGQVSAGLPRMLAVVVPLFAILTVYSLDTLDRGFEMGRSSHFVSGAIAVIIVANGLMKIKLPVELGQEEKTLNRVAEYIRANGLTDHKIHYYALYNEVTLGLDPHNEEQCQQVIHTRAEPHINVEAGSLVIWDAHFAPNEGAMPLENLTNSPYFELLKVFVPDEPFNTHGDMPYEVYLFLRH